MRSQRIARKSLTEVTSLSEAVQVLQGRNISQPAKKSIKRSLDLIFRVDQSQPAGKSYVSQMLAETEGDLKKLEEEKLLGHQMNESEHEDEFEETEGNPSSGSEHPKTHDSGDKSGETAQSDGTSVEDQIDKVDNSHDGSAPAQSQSGISQLKEAIQQVADQGSVDPMNKAVIDYMSNGMSQIEATNAASMDNNMMEAVFAKKLAKIVPKLLTPFVNEISSLHRTIRVYDNKIESMRKQSGQQAGGLSETIMIQAPGQPGKTVTNRLEGQTVEQISKSIADKYIDLS